MADYGLTAHGFKRKRYADIIAEKESRARELFGENVNLSEASPLGLFIRLNAWEESRAWQVAEDVYFSPYVDYAEGVQLDKICQFISITRAPALRAEGEAVFTGEDGTTIPDGFLIETEDGIQFETTEEAEIDGDTTVEIIAVEPGSEGNVPASTITEITNPTSGIDTVTNPEAIDGGEDREKDHELRERYKRSAAQPGSSTTSSIEATLLDIKDVEDAYVRENDTEAEVDGVPTKSIHPLVFGGPASDIAKAIYGVKAGGIRSHGTDETVTVTDSMGKEHTIGFDRPDQINVYYNVQLETDDDFPTDGLDQVQDKILEYTNALRMGDDVIYTRIIAKIQEVSGVTDIPTLEVDTSDPPAGEANITIAFDEVARTAEANIEVSEV